METSSSDSAVVEPPAALADLEHSVVVESSAGPVEPSSGGSVAVAPAGQSQRERSEIFKMYLYASHTSTRHPESRKTYHLKVLNRSKNSLASQRLKRLPSSRVLLNMMSWRGQILIPNSVTKMSLKILQELPI